MTFLYISTVSVKIINISGIYMKDIHKPYFWMDKAYTDGLTKRVNI